MDIAELLKRAEAADAGEDDEGQRLPDEIARRGEAARDSLRRRPKKGHAWKGLETREKVTAVPTFDFWFCTTRSTCERCKRQWVKSI